MARSNFELYSTMYDKINVPRFQAGENFGYICTNCGQSAFYDGSISHHGYNLICNRCYYKLMKIIGSDYHLMLMIQKVGQETETKCKEEGT